MTEITRQTVTLINQRDGQERYTRYNLGDVVEMIRKGKLKSGKLIEEQEHSVRYGLNIADYKALELSCRCLVDIRHLYPVHL